MISRRHLLIIKFDYAMAAYSSFCENMVMPSFCFAVVMFSVIDRIIWPVYAYSSALFLWHFSNLDSLGIIEYHR